MALVGSLFLAATADAGEAPQDGKVFAFDGGYVLDLGKSLYANPPRPRRSVQDCSDSKMFCVKPDDGDPERTFSFTLPRTCTDPTTATEWHSNGAVTKVIAIQEKLEPLPAGGFMVKTWFLADPRNQKVVYEYRPVDGITALIVGRTGENVIEEVARAKGVPDALQNFTYHLMTFDSLGGCRDR